MVTESIVVIAIILIMSYMYLRRGKRGMAASVLPLAVLPFFCLLGVLMRQRLPGTWFTAGQWGALFIMGGVVVAGSLFGVISSNIKKKSARRAYLLLCGGFTLFFAFAELLKIL